MHSLLHQPLLGGRSCCRQSSLATPSCLVSPINRRFAPSLVSSAERWRSSTTCSSKAHDEEVALHETKLGPGVNTDKRSQRHYSAATVIRNEAANLDGSIRLLHLAVTDRVDMLYGRRVKGVPDSHRWIDSYTLPGQCVDVRMPATASDRSGAEASAAPSGRLCTIASSPYQSRRDSAYLDACIIEIVVQRGASAEDDQLAGLGPGAEVEVSQVIGRGFASLLNSFGGIQAAIEEQRSMVLVGVGSRGISALRAALNWQPVMAHAAGHRVSALYVARCMAQAAFVTEWDQWREAGVHFEALYTEPGARVSDVEAAMQGSGTTTAAAPTAAPNVLTSMDATEALELLEDALFYREGGLERVAGGKASECCVLMAGLPPAIAPKLAKELHAHKVDHERMLFCDYF